MRQRANSASAETMSTSTSASTYPRRRPTRKAPPVPKTQAEGESGTPEHQPIANNENHTEATGEDASNLEDIMANLMASTQELQAAMEYSMTEEEPQSFTESPEPPTTPTDPTSVPSSTATPVPNSQETTTPDSMVNGVDTKKEELTRSLDDLAEKSSIQVTTNTGSGKRKSTKKRVGSMKAMRRSVSPPNVPPPPPPSFDDEAKRRTPPRPPADATDGSPPQPATQQKYLKMMDSFNDIGDELNQIASELSVKENTTPKAKPPTPARVSSLSQADKSSSNTSSEVGDYLDEAFERQDILEEERSESMEVLVDTGKTETSPGILRKGKERTGERGQVTFQDTTSQAYEPRIDQEAVPTSVADAKLKLFGEKDASRFSKTVIQNQNRALNTNNNNGDQSTQPTPSTSSLPTLSNAEDLLHSIENALQTTSYMEHQKLSEEAEENAYESPWDNKAIARYGLPGSDRGGVSFSADLGRKGRSLERKRRSAGSPQHAMTTPPPAAQAPSSSQSVENILGRSATFSSTTHSLTRPSHRSVSMASDLERQHLQQWLKREQNGKKFPPPIAPKKTQANYNTLPNWSQLKSSGTQVSYNSSMQSTVYRSLV